MEHNGNGRLFIAYQEIPFIVYKCRHKGEKQNYETKNIIDAFECYGDEGPYDISKEMHVKGNKF